MSSPQQLLVAAVALVAAWIPAATIAAPTASPDAAPYVVEATRVLPRQAPVCRPAVDRDERPCSSAHL